MVSDDDVDVLEPASARSTTGPVGFVSVPPFTPSWPSAMIASIRFRARPRPPRSPGDVVRGWNGPRCRGKISSASSFVKPTARFRGRRTGRSSTSTTRRRVSGRVDDVRRQEGEVGEGRDRPSHIRLADVELMVSERVGFEAHHVHDRGSRRVAEEVRDRRRRTDGVAGGQSEAGRPGRPFGSRRTTY